MPYEEGYDHGKYDSEMEEARHESCDSSGFTNRFCFLSAEEEEEENEE